MELNINPNSDVVKKSVSVKDEIKDVINKKIATFPSTAEAKISFEEWTNYSWKTLTNFLDDITNPYPITIISFYSWSLQTREETDIFNSLNNRQKGYLVSMGYEVAPKKKDITKILNRSKNHAHLYDLTADNRIISKKTVENYGEDSVLALNDLLLEEVILPLPGDTYTTGSTRAITDLDYYKTCARHAIDNFPWHLVAQDHGTDQAGLQYGNICIPTENREEVISSIISLSKKVSKLREKASKLPQDKVDNIGLLTLAFNLDPK